MMHHSLCRDSAFDRLFTSCECYELMLNSVRDVVTNFLVVKVTLSCQECANDILFDGISFILELFIRGTAVAEIGTSVFDITVEVSPRCVL